MKKTAGFTAAVLAGALVLTTVMAACIVVEKTGESRTETTTETTEEPQMPETVIDGEPEPVPEPPEEPETKQPGPQEPETEEPGGKLGKILSVPENSIVLFSEIEGTETLVKDMLAGRIPTECNVLYDTMGARPDVTVTDAGTIRAIYERLCEIEVVGESQYSVTDCYHHVIFTLQDGSRVSYRFEGEGVLDLGTYDLYEVTGGSSLWSLVQGLQNEYMEKTERGCTVIEDA